MAILCILTNKFPYTTVEPYLETEVLHYKQFDKVILCSLIVKEKELHDLKAINNNLNKELKLIQDTCDMLKDENYIIKILGYWSPQAMFKYIQAYDKQQTPNQ